MRLTAPRCPSCIHSVNFHPSIAPWATTRTESIICALLKEKKCPWIVSLIDIHWHLFFKALIIFYLWKLDMWEHFKHNLFSVKCKLCGLQKAWGLFPPLMLIFPRFAFNSAICCNFCLFWVSFIFSSLVSLTVICGSFTLGRLFDFFSNSWFNWALYFYLKNLFRWKKY